MILRTRSIFQLRLVVQLTVSSTSRHVN